MNRRHEVLFEQLLAYRGELLQLVANLSEAEADRVPEGFNNNIRWNLGHVYVDQYLWIKALTKEELPFPSAYLNWFGYGTCPRHFTDETPALSQLLHDLQQQPHMIREKYQDHLEDEYPETEMGMHTIEQVLIRTIFHEGLHIGAIQALLRALK